MGMRRLKRVNYNSAEGFDVVPLADLIQSMWASAGDDPDRIARVRKFGLEELPELLDSESGVYHMGKNGLSESQFVEYNADTKRMRFLDGTHPEVLKVKASWQKGHIEGDADDNEYLERIVVPQGYHDQYEEFLKEADEQAIMDERQARLDWLVANVDRIKGLLGD